MLRGNYHYCYVTMDFNQLQDLLLFTVHRMSNNRRICCCSQCIVRATIVGFSGSRALLSSTKGAREALEGHADYVLTIDLKIG